MLEIEIAFAKAFVVGDLEAVLAQALTPEVQGRRWNRQAHIADLATAATAFHAGVSDREGRHQRTLIAGVIAIIEMIDRRDAVVEGGLLDALETEHLGVEVVIFLRTAGRDRDVMVTGDEAAGCG